MHDSKMTLSIKLKKRKELYTNYLKLKKSGNTIATSNFTKYTKTTISTKQLVFKSNTSAIMIIITPSMREVKGLFFSFKMLLVTEELCDAP